MAKTTSVVTEGHEMLDITEPVHEVEIMYSNGNLWINIDGRCRLRCTRIKPDIMSWNIDSEERKPELVIRPKEKS